MKNLIKRALTGIIFVAVLVGAICYHPISFLVLFSLITGLTLWEFYGLVKHYEDASIKRAVSSLGGVYLFAATFAYTNQLTDGVVFLPYLLFLIYTLVAELYYKAPNPINNWAFTLFAQVYCAGTFSMLNFIAAIPDTPGKVVYSPLFVMAIFIFIWLNDTGAYLVGSMIGKRKLFERISPKKSWEGFFGGLAVVLALRRLWHGMHRKLVGITGWDCRLPLSYSDLGRSDRIVAETYIGSKRFRQRAARPWRNA